MQPARSTASKAEAAEFFLVSLPTIDAWIRKGAPVVQRGARGVPWQIDLRAMAEWVYSAGGGGGGEQTDPEKLTPIERKAWYEGEAKRLDLQERHRDLIPAGEVERVVAIAFAAIGQDLRAIPDNLERRTGLSGEIAEQVERELFQAMETLADKLSSLAIIEE